MNWKKDPILSAIVDELITKHRCHTVVLYGSRARGQVTLTSDYDVMGVRSRGSELRIAKKQEGFFWDVFVYPEKDLKNIDGKVFDLKHAKVLYQEGKYGTDLIRRIKKGLKIPFKKHSQFEIDVVKVWAQKELERCRINDTQGLYRRIEFLGALVDHYFYVRQKRYLGPKAGLETMQKNDPTTFKLVKRAFKYPTNLSFLKAAATKVYKTDLT